MADFDFTGNPFAEPSDLEADIEAKCRGDWDDRARCIVIRPEIEAWVWSDSPNVAAALGWESMVSLRRWLDARGLWKAGLPKPTDPKAALTACTRESRTPSSAATFRKLAETVGFQRCTDPAFVRLLRTLRAWFPPAS